MVSGSNEAFNARHRTLLLRGEDRGVDTRGRQRESCKGRAIVRKIVMTGGRPGKGSPPETGAPLAGIPYFLTSP